MDNSTIDASLLFAQCAINESVLTPYLNEFGYNGERLQEGHTLYDKTSDCSPLPSNSCGKYIV